MKRKEKAALFFLENQNQRRARSEAAGCLVSQKRLNKKGLRRKYMYILFSF